MLNLSQAEVAEMVGISVPTLKRAESDHPAVLAVADETRKKIRAVLEGAGIEFLDGDAPGVRLKRKLRRK
jgi:transcriptional regulator with XRE-family HTH domain